MARLSPKRYLIRVVDKAHLDMSEIIEYNTSGKRYKDLDGEEVSFKSGFRPRARYLYFHYCTTMLRRSWLQPEAAKILKDELGQRFWGMPGRYMPRNMLMAHCISRGCEWWNPVLLQPRTRTFHSCSRGEWRRFGRFGRGLGWTCDTMADSVQKWV